MKSPSNWINLQNYLGVNDEMGQQMAGKVAGQVGDQAGKAAGQLATDQQAFGDKSKAGTLGWNGQDTGTSADALAKSGQGYSGPTSLGEMDAGLEKQIGDASARVKAAGTTTGQQAETAQAYGGKTGGGGLDSFLLSNAGGGSTGGGAMGDLNAKYGTLDQTGMAANDASIKTAGQAAQTSADNAKLWGKTAATRKTAEDATAKATADKASAADLDKRFEAAMGHSTEDDMNNVFHDFNEVMSPISQIANATGNKDPLHNYGTTEWNHTGQDAHGQRADGSTNGQHIWWQPSDKPVFAQMDQAQWAELNSLPKESQNKWIKKRGWEIANHVAYKRGSATRTNEELSSVPGNEMRGSGGYRAVV